MVIQYGKIKMKSKLLLEAGSIKISNTGCYIVKGANGCGKSLWLKRLYVDMLPVSTLVSQDNHEIIPGLPVIENISMCSDKDKKNRIICGLQKYKLDYLLDLKSDKMSGGEKRIISVLRGIYSEKEMILIDEPSNDLDYLMVEKLIHIIQDFKQDKLFIMVTHDDRFNNLLDGQLIFEDKKIKQEFRTEIKEEKQIKEAETKSDRIGYISKKGIVSILLMILLGGIFLRVILLSFNAEKMEQFELGKEQVNLYVPASQMGAYAGLHGAFFVSAIEQTLSENIFTAVRQSEDSSVLMDRNLSVNLDELLDMDGLEIYPLEYYDYEKKAYRYPLSIFAAEKGYNSDFTYVETMPLFYNFYWFQNQNTIEFDRNEFKAIIKQLEQDKDFQNFHIVYATVILKNGMTLTDFVNLKEMKKLAEEKCILVQSNETISLYHQILEVLSYEQLIRKVLIFSILIVLIDIGYQFIYLRAKRNSIQIFAHYGIKAADLKSALRKAEIDLPFGVAWVVVLFAIQLIFMVRYSVESSLMAYMPFACVVLVLCASWFAKQRMLSIAVNRAYNWKKR